MPDAGVLATILLMAGLFLVAVELMIPSFGMIGILAAICLGVSAWSAWQAWWERDPAFFWTYLGFWVIGIPTVIVSTLYMIQHTSLGNLAILKGREQTQDGPLPQVQDQLHELVGHEGQTLSPLTPGGMVRVNGERFHAECLGPSLESGVRVQVVDARGTRLVVRAPRRDLPEDDHDGNPASISTADTASSAETDQLDFEIPDQYTAADDTPPGTAS